MSKTLFSNLLGLVMGLYIQISHAESALQIDVFYGQGQHIINTQQAKRYATIRLYDLTRPERLEEKLSKGLPTDPVLAEQAAKKRLKRSGGSLQKQLSDAYEGALLASQYGITQLPAVVFNQGEQVIYGVNDLRRSIKLYRKHAK